MHALIVVAHPDTQSLTHAVAAQVAQGAAEGGHGVEIADLHREGFDPRYNADDLALFRQQAGVPADVLAEQQRIDRADALVLVYPVYWWSFPGLLKGWVDRVFTHGWGYEEQADGTLVKKLGHLPVHLLGIAAANQRTWDRRGYGSALRTQIDDGIFGYVGAPVVSSQLLLLPEEGGPQAILESAYATGTRLFV